MTKSEAQTRSDIIDKQLAQSGWNVKDPTQVSQELDILTPLPEGVAESRTPYEGHPQDPQLYRHGGCVNALGPCRKSAAITMAGCIG